MKRAEGPVASRVRAPEPRMGWEESAEASRDGDERGGSGLLSPQMAELNPRDSALAGCKMGNVTGIPVVL